MPNPAPTHFPGANIGTVFAFPLPLIFLKLFIKLLKTLQSRISYCINTLENAKNICSAEQGLIRPLPSDPKHGIIKTGIYTLKTDFSIPPKNKNPGLAFNGQTEIFLHYKRKHYAVFRLFRAKV